MIEALILAEPREAAANAERLAAEALAAGRDAALGPDPAPDAVVDPSDTRVPVPAR
jgi:hypothetical protein